MKPGEKIVTKVKSKRDGRRFAITSCAQKPHQDAVEVLKDDDLEPA